MYKACGLAVRLAVLILVSVTVAMSVSAESFFEYYFIPEDEQEAGTEPAYNYDSFFDELPEEVKEYLPEEMLSDDSLALADEAEEITDFSYVMEKITDALSAALVPSLQTAASMLGVILVAAILRSLRNNIGGSSVSEMADTVINIGMGITLIGTQIAVLDTLESFRILICNLMNGMIPLISGIFIASGNSGTAAVQSGGIMMLVTLCNNIFASVLMPAVRICLVFAVIGAVFPETGAKSVTDAFKNITLTIMITVMTLFSFILGLQNSIAQSADTFGTKSIKFAIGNIIPVVGGAVSDSLGTIGGSLSVLKSVGGNIVIIIIIILLVPTIVSLLCNRFILFLCKSVSGILGCKNEEELLGEMGSVSSMMIAFAASVGIAFIYSLTLFTKATLATAA